MRERGIEPATLFTTVNARHGRVSIHGVRRELLRVQAESLGVPLVELELPDACSYEEYAELVQHALQRPPLAACRKIAFGDLFLEEVRRSREAELAQIGRAAVFPLWRRDTTQLAHDFVDAGNHGLVVCVDAARLPTAFAGRRYDRSFLRDLPPAVDPCGENGEFHTVVLDGPPFTRRVAARAVGVVVRDGQVYCDVALPPAA
ncbi:MAG: ATP-binding protein [Actinomycetota bacterium]|nr:ATP-binding protein [Actinomycetota bacterium]